MSEKLTDPNKTAHEIIDVLEDGDAIRNYGGRLTAANKNPWYVLATIYGEQEQGATQSNYDKELAAKNRRAWNGWFCGGLSEDERHELAEGLGLNVTDLVPLTDSDRNEILTEFRRRLGNTDAELPSQTVDIDFEKTYFARFLCFSKFTFLTRTSFDEATLSKGAHFEYAIFRKRIAFYKTSFICQTNFKYARFSETVFCNNAKFHTEADFSGAKFQSEANFYHAIFNKDTKFSEVEFSKSNEFSNVIFGGEIDFVNARFGECSNFKSAQFHKRASFNHAIFEDSVNINERVTFKESALFSKAMFRKDTEFSTAVFGGLAQFTNASFDGKASFENATFHKRVKFNSVNFGSTTRFNDVKFVTAVPEFHAAEIYDDTTFTLRDDFRQNWPPLTRTVQIEGMGESVGIMTAKDQKRAYNRLRLFMNRSLQIDEEQFFHRMEMRCKKEMADGAHRWIYWLYEKLSNYGDSVRRPVVGMGLLIAVGAALMLFHLEMGKPATGAQFWTATGWSISNTLPFLGFGKLYYGGDFAKCLPVPLKIIGGVQTLFGFILLFFLGLGLRNRFRLR